MRVLSPVGTFPVRMKGLRRKGRSVVIDADMGVWHSEVSLERRDGLVIVGALVAFVAVFVAAMRLGRRSATQ